MQKIIQFTRQEVVEQLENRVAALRPGLDIIEDGNISSLILVATLLADAHSLMRDIEYFDVFIHRSLFSELKETIATLQVSINSFPDESEAVEELAQLKEKLAALGI